MARKKKFFIDAYWPREPKASGRDKDCLWFHAGKKYRVHVGDSVLLFETKVHPDHDDWRGSGKVFQSATATGEPIKVLDLPTVGGQLWDYKMPLNIEIKVDRDKGIDWGKVRKILGWKPGATLRNPPLEITESQFLLIEDELRKLIEDHDESALISEETFLQKQAIREKQAAKLSLDELRDKIEGTSKKLGVRNVISRQYDRNSDIAEFVKRKAGGICDLCENEAPFKDKTGRPYLETHHIEWLSRGGEDSIENTVGVCPNCHRKMHILDSKKDKDFLSEKALKRA